ncbi:RNA polymerase sigma factor [Sphingobium lignivorans]|uniref:DNA-directed RNA polymerase specialized sigma24 family protein n=1 Tax=Sphingobium lignivorans TaxID=2735886 RepID=A0ABR6NH76_9SPHN|nr:sigma factor-like helix-turn-helix DNA-binding protein [Sphingobium lignivorans]MBB5986621.1 DNA-directed RNA polymerase specialized sigma24 family protein [Sphingobium lignivorans]
MTGIDEDPDRIRAAVAALPEPMRSVFRLHSADGLDYPTIGIRLGISLCEVERQLGAAIVQIGRTLGNAPDG